MNRLVRSLAVVPAVVLIACASGGSAGESRIAVQPNYVHRMAR
jgi:hypothetical protein